jgi:hypothetical protein
MTFRCEENQLPVIDRADFYGTNQESGIDAWFTPNMDVGGERKIA